MTEPRRLHTLQTSGGPADTEIRRSIRALDPWFHNLHLPGDEQTAPDHPLGDFPRFKWEQIAHHLPPDLTGWSALDIGCNAGFYTFELARRGADVLGVDHDEHYLAQARWAREQMHLEKTHFEKATVYDLPRLGKTFDLVWFMGVFYHLRYPMLALNAAALATDRLLVFQTLTTRADTDPPQHATPREPDLGLRERSRLRDEDWPRMSLVEQRFAGDPTNWWIPDPAACEAMLRSAGMRITSRPGHEIYICEPDPEAQDQREATRAELDAVYNAR